MFTTLNYKKFDQINGTVLCKKLIIPNLLVPQVGHEICHPHGFFNICSIYDTEEGLTPKELYIQRTIIGKTYSVKPTF